MKKGYDKNSKANPSKGKKMVKKGYQFGKQVDSAAEEKKETKKVK